MSVAELTINYVARPSIEIFGQIKDTDFAFSQHKRKILLLSFAAVFVVSVSAYLYLAGSIVGLGAAQNDLKEKLDYALIASSEKEAEFIKSVYRRNSDFFAENGYEKPLSIEVIKRSFNVVEISQARQLY